MAELAHAKEEEASEVEYTEDTDEGDKHAEEDEGG